MKIIAPPHTPLHPNGSLNLEVVELQAEHFRRTGISGVFVAGSTGEGQSLSVAERMALAESWVEVAPEFGLEVLIQVGHNCHEDACYLARHAAEIGVDAISASAPCYYRPATVDDLVVTCADLARSANSTPFYFYDIPSLTNVRLPIVSFIESAVEQIPTFAGVKYTNPDLMQLQECLQTSAGKSEILFGCDELLLSGYMFGCRGAVGSTYNLFASHASTMIASFESGDVEIAAKMQNKLVAAIRCMQRFGFTASCKTAMKLVGIDCGPPRLPIRGLSEQDEESLLSQLRGMELTFDSAHTK